MTEEPLTSNSSDSSLSSNQEQPQQQKKKEKLGVIAASFFVFVCTSAGPFGVEETVSAAGPLFTIISLILCPIFIIIPICLMMEELGSWMPTHHGSIRWITRSLGPTIGFFNAFYQMMMNVVDNAVYPVLACDFIVAQFAPDMSYGGKVAIRLAIIIVFGIPNYFPMHEVGILSAFITILIISPFVVGFFAGVSHIDTSSWDQSNSGQDMKMSTLLAISLWMYSGFVSLGSITPDCEPGALFKGQMVALFFDVLFYLLPLSVTFQIDTNWNNWTDGYLAKLFDKVLPGLGYAVSIGGAFSGIGLFTTSVAAYARTMWGIADLGWLPRILTRKNRYDVPHINVSILLVTTLALSLFEMDFLVRLEFVFASCTYICFVLAFIVLRYTEPDAYRPFRVPGGELGAILIPMPLLILVCGVLGSDFTDWRLLLAFIGATVFAIGLHVYLRSTRTPEHDIALRKLLIGEEGGGEETEVELDEDASEMKSDVRLVDVADGANTNNNKES